MDNTIHQIQFEVGTWHRSVFGTHDPYDHIAGIAQKAQEEARELHEQAEVFRSIGNAEEEIADLLICALAAADRLGMDAAEAIRAKLAVLAHPDRNQLERDRIRGIMQAADRASEP